MNKQKVAVRIVGLTKRFPGVVALNNVDFDLHYGEVHAVVGQNGAGKSTLVKILNGIYVLDHGEIYIEDQLIKIRNPADAKRYGITLVHQELMVYPNLTVAENIYIAKLSKEERFITIVNPHELRDFAIKYLNIVGLNIDPFTKMKNLGVGEQQLVQVARALAENARIICFDEPTSALTPAEVSRLFNVINELKRIDKAIVYITHYIDEIFKIADRVTVLRDGMKVITKKVKETNGAEIVKYMLGRDLEEFYVKRTVASREKKEPILVVKNLSVLPTRISEVPLSGVSFELARGEILGIVGLLGAGKTELAKALIGMEKIVSGEIYINGKKVIIKSPKDAVKYGLFYLPENRRVEGLIPVLSVKDNIIIVSEENIRNIKKEIAIANEWVRKLNIKTPSLFTKVSSLSGGTQQKVVIAKFLTRNVKIMIFDEPTIGIDVSTKVEIRKIIAQLADSGVAIILATSDIDEALSLSDKLLVLYKGRVVGYFQNYGLSREKIIELLSGSSKVIEYG